MNLEWLKKIGVLPGEKAELLDDMNKQFMPSFAWIGAFSEDGKVWNWTDGTEIQKVSSLSLQLEQLNIVLDQQKGEVVQIQLQ